MSVSLNRHGRELALSVLRALPRLSLNNITPNQKKKVSFRWISIISEKQIWFIVRTFYNFLQTKRGRGQHGGNYHGNGQKRWVTLRLGYECTNRPFYRRFGCEPYYKGHQ